LCLNSSTFSYIGLRWMRKVLLNYLRTKYSQQKSAITYPGPVLGYFHRVRPGEAPKLVQEFLAFYEQMTTVPASEAAAVAAPER
jgi:hypothetical protein